jgi:hypothetical protein
LKEFFIKSWLTWHFLLVQKRGWTKKFERKQVFIFLLKKCQSISLQEHGLITKLHQSHIFRFHLFSCNFYVYSVKNTVSYLIIHQTRFYTVEPIKILRTWFDHKNMVWLQNYIRVIYLGSIYLVVQCKKYS